MIRELNHYLKLVKTITREFIFVNHNGHRETDYDPKYCVLAHDKSNCSLKISYYSLTFKHLMEL